jgi:Holliday junction DNA helicase RuvA
VFYYIEGRVAELLPQLAVIDCGGVGYGLNTTTTTLARLKIGDRAKLYTYLQVREDCFDLYGFYSIAEKRSFEMLIGISGVGPKAALSILSASTPETLAMAIVRGDEKALTIAPGIGKKIAQRVILELKDKIGKEMGGLTPIQFPETAPVPDAEHGALHDALAALVVLGYGQAEAMQALRGIEPEGHTVEELIKLALKNMIK